MSRLLALLLASLKRLHALSRVVNAMVSLRASFVKNTRALPSLLWRILEWFTSRLLFKIWTWTRYLLMGSTSSNPNRSDSDIINGSRIDEALSVYAPSAEPKLQLYQNLASMTDTSHDASIPCTNDSCSVILPETRPAEMELDLGDYIAKGTKLSSCLDMDAATLTLKLQAEGKIALNEGAASPFTQYRQLSSCGWECFSEPVEVGGTRLRERRTILNSLGISRWVGHNTSVSSIHNKPYTTASGQVIRPSYGEYTAIHNPRDGMIISYLETGPQFKISQKKEVQVLPNVSRWADVTYLNYMHQATKQGLPTNRLKHIFRTDIESPEVQKVIQMVVGPDCSAYLPWHRRRTFTADSTQANALLGTESGRGILWMILRHPELGKKRVRNVSVYGQVRNVVDRHDLEAEGNRVHLYFELVDR